MDMSEKEIIDISFFMKKELVNKDFNFEEFKKNYVICRKFEGSL